MKQVSEQPQLLRNGRKLLTTIPPLKLDFQSAEDACIHGHFNSKEGHGVFDYYSAKVPRITILRDPWETHLSCVRFVKSYHSDTPCDEADYLAYLRKRPNSYFLDFLPNWHLFSPEEYLNEFFFVGVTEYLQQSVDMLAKRLNKPSRIVKRVNCTNNLQIESIELKKAKERFICDNEWIYEFYTAAKRQFEAQAK